MRKLLSKIFSTRKSIFQLIFAGFGLLSGFVLLLFSTQLYLQINRLLNPSNASSEYLIVSKKINIGHTLMLTDANFSKEEIETIRKKPFIDNVSEFTSSQYEVVAYSKGQIPFLTELFFESVPDEIIDKRPEEFRWKEGDKLVPVILSQEFLNLYNFGFALSKGLPKVYKSTAGLLEIELEIKGKKEKKIFKAKIVGFSERIPSVLVPLSFMQWANKNIGEAKTISSGRLILKVKNPSDPALARFFEENDLQINEDRLQASKINTVISIVMSIIGIIGILFILLSFVIFMMNFRVIIAEAKDEIKLLLQLGYTPNILAGFLIFNFLFFILTMIGLASVVLYYCIQEAEKFLIDNGLEVSKGIEAPVIWIGLIFAGLIVSSNIYSVFRLLRKYA